jgi:hypothetical protein
VAGIDSVKRKVNKLLCFNVGVNNDKSLAEFAGLF